MALPPSNVDLAIRIEKLADYVARNGIQFEQVTRQKQYGNPEFSFLEDGDANNAYYRHVVNCLQYGGWTLDQIIQVRNQSPQNNTVSLLLLSIFGLSLYAQDSVIPHTLEQSKYINPRPKYNHTQDCAHI
jgi:hypothetical protein